MLVVLFDDRPSAGSARRRPHEAHHQCVRGLYPDIVRAGSGTRLGPDVSESVATRPIVGAIRWDAWYGRGSPVTEVEKTLGPKKYHFVCRSSRKVTSPATVSIDGDSQQAMEQEISYGRQCGLNYWAFVDYWDQGNLGIGLRRYRAAGTRRPPILPHEEGGRIDRIGTSGWPRLVTCFKDPHYQTVLDGDHSCSSSVARRSWARRNSSRLPTKRSSLDSRSRISCSWAGIRRPTPGGKDTGLRCGLRLRGGAGYRWEQWPYETTDQTRADRVLGGLPPAADSDHHVCHGGVGSQATRRTSGPVDRR